jgi:hypothetical protein
VSETSIGVSHEQKRALISFRSHLEKELERNVTQGEAMKVAAWLGEDHLEECSVVSRRDPRTELESISYGDANA